jgi:hypothetical protein
MSPESQIELAKNLTVEVGETVTALNQLSELDPALVALFKEEVAYKLGEYLSRLERSLLGDFMYFSLHVFLFEILLTVSALPRLGPELYITFQAAVATAVTGKSFSLSREAWARRNPQEYILRSFGKLQQGILKDAEAIKAGKPPARFVNALEEANKANETATTAPAEIS